MERRKIAVIGAGISGIGAAYLLSPFHDVVLYERNKYAGGHTRTLDVQTRDGSFAVDTGFIVFNDRNYPLLTKLFGQLGIPSHKSDMSFGASIDNGWLEYGTKDVLSIFSQKLNLIRPPFLGMVRDVLRFNKRALAYLDKPASFTLAECLSELALGDWFKHYYLLPMAGSIWSSPPGKILNFPASTLVRFFNNHGLLSTSGQPKWFTVTGGGKTYVDRILTQLNGPVRFSAVQAVERNKNNIRVIDSSGESDTFDEVVLACHADEALKMIRDPRPEETEILSAFQYQENKIILHSDSSFMPKRKGAWASWVYLLENRSDETPEISLSYWMNNLQNLNTDIPLLVTLNPARDPSEDLIYDRHEFSHPVFDSRAIAAQDRIMEIQGRDRLWFCGAYQRYGFHEDGFWSAARAADKMGVPLPW